MNKILERAIEARHELVSIERNGKRIYTLSSTAPQWVMDMVRTAHGDILPDDYKYQFIVDALDLIIENEGFTLELGDKIESDIYTHDLTTWLNSNTSRIEYCQEVVDEGMSGNNFIEIVQTGQNLERLEVFYSILNSLDKH